MDCTAITGILLTATEADFLSPSFAGISSRCVIFQSHCHTTIMFYAKCLLLFTSEARRLSQGVPPEIFCGTGDPGTGFVLTKWYWDRICIGSGCNRTDVHRLQDKVTPGQDFLHLLIFGLSSWYPGMSHILIRSSAVDSMYSNGKPH